MKVQMKMLALLVVCVVVMGPVSAEEAPVIIDESVKAAVREQLAQDAQELEAQVKAAEAEQKTLDQIVDNLKDIDDIQFAMENKVCPVTGKTFGPDVPYVEVEWEGGVYRVCADGCKESFLADPDKYAQIVEKEVGTFF